MLIADDTQTLTAAERWSLAGNLTRRRRQAGWTMAELAAQIGVHRSTISRLENAETPAPTVATLAALARVFGVSIAGLIKPFGPPPVETHNALCIPHCEDLLTMTAPPTAAFSTRHGDLLVLMVPTADTAARPADDRLVLVATATGRRIVPASEARSLAGEVEAVEVSRWCRSG